MATSTQSRSSPQLNENKHSATPYTPFSPFKSKSRSRELITSISTSESCTFSLPPSSTTNSNSLSQLSMSIGSKTDLVASPDGMSIQLAPETPHVLSPKKILLSDSTTISPIFRDDIRQEWINAMFGREFFPELTENASDTATDYTPPRQGMGLAGIPSYLSYTATIPPAKEGANAGNKVGMTLSRIPIGVYVRLVDLQSEAYAAGIVPGSILLDVNGMGVLGEPSHKLLERLWKFEGHFDDFIECDDNHKNNGDKDFGDSSKSEKSDRATIVLKLIKDGVVYNAILISGSPSGISWAPCGNFALVQRTYAAAQKAGVRRGCIVAAVNDKSLREMNHLDTAMYLKDQFDKAKEIRVVCVFTPAASRTGHHDRRSAKKTKRQENEIRTIDGVRIRKVTLASKNKEKPTEYGVGSFFTCGTGIQYQPNSADTSLSDFDVVVEIANRVAAGEVAAPTGRNRGIKKKNENAALSFSTLVSEYISDTNSLEDSPQKDVIIKFKGNTVVFPKVSWFDLLPSWDGLEALVFCLRMHEADYCEEKFYDIGGIVGAAGGRSALLSGKNESYDRYPLHSREANATLIRAAGLGENGSGDAYHSYLLQIVALISSREIFERAVAELFNANFSTIDSLSGSKKKDYVQKLNAEAKVKTETICEEIVEAIVTIAMTDDALCQSFHFLLRSFSSTIVKKKDDDDTVFAPIKMLTSAHCLLRNRLMDRDIKCAPSILSYGSMNNHSEQNGDISMASIDGFGSIESPEYDRKPEGAKKSRSKRFGKFFRRGSKKGSTKDESSKVGESSDSADVDADVDADADDSPKKVNHLPFRPHSILRKAADQNPQDNESRGTEPLVTDVPSTANLFENMGWFLSNLDQLCGKVENALLKSFSQKLTEWALQPWNPIKDRALADGTADMRNGLHVINLLGRSRSKDNDKKWAPVINPVNSSEFLVSIIPEESYILPSAHFPLLLAFKSCTRPDTDNGIPSESSAGETDTLYRTTVKINVIRGSKTKGTHEDDKKKGFAYVVNATLGGNLKETGKSTLDPYYESSTHRWHERNTMEFETMSSTGAPSSIMFRLSSVSFDSSGKEQIALSDENGTNYYSSEVGFSFLEIGNMWKRKSSKKGSFQLDVFDYDSQPDFDQQGFMVDDMKATTQKLSIELEVTTEAFPFKDGKGIGQSTSRKQTLLYKHDEDMRQEMLATQFLDVCDRILKASGLDLKMKKYKCIPVGERKGFIEWVPGAFSLSELCKPMGSAIKQNGSRNKAVTITDSEIDPSSSGIDNDTNSSAFIRTGGWCKFESMRSLRQTIKTVSKHGIGISGNNPVQDFFRSNAYDAEAPYLIQKEVMDNFVKSCAGYSVITYLLGVGDRHTDNLLLHPRGHFLHCDFSFILGQDPKTYLPMRITEHMVNGMGGRDSDNFSMFLSLAGAAFVTLRRHASVRVLLSTVRMMADSEIPDITINQNPDVALQGMHERFRLDLNDDEAVSFLEENIERSISSKIWIAVDAIHSLGKRF